MASHFQVQSLVNNQSCILLKLSYIISFYMFLYKDFHRRIMRINKLCANKKSKLKLNDSNRNTLINQQFLKLNPIPLSNFNRTPKGIERIPSFQKKVLQKSQEKMILQENKTRNRFFSIKKENYHLKLDNRRREQTLPSKIIQCDKDSTELELNIYNIFQEIQKSSVISFQEPIIWAIKRQILVKLIKKVLQSFKIQNKQQINQSKDQTFSFLNDILSKTVKDINKENKKKKMLKNTLVPILTQTYRSQNSELQYNSMINQLQDLFDNSNLKKLEEKQCTEDQKINNVSETQAKQDEQEISEIYNMINQFIDQKQQAVDYLDKEKEIQTEIKQQVNPTFCFINGDKEAQCYKENCKYFQLAQYRITQYVKELQNGHKALEEDYQPLNITLIPQRIQETHSQINQILLANNQMSLLQKQKIMTIFIDKVHFRYKAKDLEMRKRLQSKTSFIEGFISKVKTWRHYYTIKNEILKKLKVSFVSQSLKMKEYFKDLQNLGSVVNETSIQSINQINHIYQRLLKCFIQGFSFY